MKRALVVGWILWLLPGAAGGTETLRIATYNVENYVAVNRVTTMGYRPDYPKTEAAKQALRRVIREMAADVIMLQEMGPRPYLDELQRDLASEGVDYPHAVLLEAGDVSRHVALLSKLALKSVVAHTDLGFNYLEGWQPVKRGLLEVTLATRAGELTLWGLHLKSRLTEHAEDPEARRRRGAEATAIRNRVLERFPDPKKARFLLLGDFNDGKNSAALRYMGRRGETRIATLLPAADSRGESWTSVYRREEIYTRVDHILVSAGLLPLVRTGKAQIHDGPGVMEASDHRPVIVVLELSGQ